MSSSNGGTTATKINAAGTTPTEQGSAEPMIGIHRAYPGSPVFLYSAPFPPVFCYRLFAAKLQRGYSATLGPRQT